MIRKLFLTLLLLGGVAALQAQSVVTKEALTENHSGTVPSAVNNGGKTLYYTFAYVATDKARYKWDDAGATRGSIRYTLNLYRDAAGKDLILSLPVQMRNLLTTYYIEAAFTKDDYEDASLREKSALMVFKKDVKWARTKFVPHEGCERADGSWDRIDRVESLQQLFDYFVGQLDRNVDFSCYGG